MLEGDLTDFTLPDVLRLLAATGKTGRLSVDDGAHRGHLELRAGHVRDVSADLSRLPLARRLLGARQVTAEALRQALTGGGGLPSDLELARRLVDAGAVAHDTLAPLLAEQTTDAAFDLFRWSAGSFRFVGLGVEGPVDDLEPVLPVEALLDEVAARLDVWPQLVAETGANDAVVTLVRPDHGDPDHAEVALGAAAWELLTLVDGRRTLGELVDLAGQGEYTTRRTLTELRHQGIVAIGEPGATGPVARRVEDHATLVDLERSAGQRPVSPAPPETVRPETVEAAPTVAQVPPPCTEAVQLPPPVVGPAVAQPQLPRVTPAATARRTATDVDPAGVGQVRQLRTTVRGERLHTDPDLDEALVTRLIEGVEAL